MINTPSTTDLGSDPSWPVLARRFGTVAAQLGALLVVLAVVIPHAANAATTDDAPRRAALRSSPLVTERTLRPRRTSKRNPTSTSCRTIFRDSTREKSQLVRERRPT